MTGITAPVRVLLIAESCNPSWTSIPLEGFQYAAALCRRPDLRVSVATHIRNRPALEARPPDGAVEVRYIDNESIAGPIHRLTKLLRSDGLSWTLNTAMTWPSYMVFERRVRKEFAGELAQGVFDLIHRVTPMTPTMGSPLASRVGIPMLIGPLNGGLPWPKEHPHLRRREREWLVPLRSLYRRLPYYKSTYRNLAGVIAGSRHAASEVPPYFSGRQYYLPENGLDPTRFPIAEDWTEPGLGERFRFITVGRLVPYKGMDLILEAMAKSDVLRGCTLEIIGSGPMCGDLEDLTRRLGLEDVVGFAGALDQVELGRRLKRSQVFVFPSLREFGGAVVLEAMASGLPSIIVNYGGPAELADAACAIRLPMADRNSLINALTKGMERLAGDHALCRKLGRAAAERVGREFTWDSKAERIARIYRELLGR